MKVRAVSRVQRNRLHRAMHGNIKVVVTNISSISNLHLAVYSNPDVALLQDLRATREEVEAEAKKHDYVAAIAEGSPCLAAVFFFDPDAGNYCGCRSGVSLGRGWLLHMSA